MREGSIILTVMIQADGQRKNRPALVLKAMPKYGDLLICGVSTNLQQYISGFDEIIELEDNDFIASGLRQNSLVRLSFLAILNSRDAIGSIGSISAERHQRLLTNLCNYLSPEDH
jgi:mRNA interferase MazF